MAEITATSELKSLLNLLARLEKTQKLALPSVHRQRMHVKIIKNKLKTAKLSHVRLSCVTLNYIWLLQTDSYT